MSAAPTPYIRQANFVNHETVSPTVPKPGTQLDAEFNALKVTTDDLRNRLAEIQRGDGLLANASVHIDALTQAAKDFLTAASATSADAAATSASNAAASASAAATSATNAANSANASATSSTSSATARDVSIAARDKANAWADNAQGVEVEPGKYSAKHWAAYVAGTVTGQLVYMGAFDASTGTYPLAPATGHFYKCTTAGTVLSVSYAVGDSIIYNGAGWDKIDNTDAVSTVAGKTGAVTLVKGDVGLGSVDNTSDAAKPVSTAQQTALNLKANLASPTFTGTVGGITKAMVGLGNVDNTTDAAKPVSTATQAALDAKLGSAATAAAATVLATARTINGTSFNGSANITTANWGTSRNLTLGSSAKAVDGSANVAWTLAEMGAVANGGSVATIVKLTQAAYDGLGTKDANTLYVIVG